VVRASEPCHSTLTTLVAASGRIPRTVASGWSSSSFMRCGGQGSTGGADPHLLGGITRPRASKATLGASGHGREDTCLAAHDQPGGRSWVTGST
jgi:hypothetical protein